MPLRVTHSPATFAGTPWHNVLALRRKGVPARLVGSFDALRWVPDAEMIPPGLDLRPYTPVPPSDRERPIVVHAPSDRVKKGTEYVIAACEQLPVELDIVEGLPHEQAQERYE